MVSNESRRSCKPGGRWYIDSTVEWSSCASPFVVGSSSAITGSWIASDFSMAGVGGMLLGTLAAGALPELSVGDFEWLICS